MKYCILILGFIHYSSHSYCQLFSNNVIHTINIISNNDSLWEQLEIDYTNLLESGVKSYQSINVIIDNDTVNNVGLRWKGAYSNTGFPGIKKPLKLDFSEFVEDQKYKGLSKLNFSNFALDPSFLREKISYEFHQRMGNAVPNSAYCNIYLNDELIGFYLMIEQVDKSFLKKHFSSKGGNLYKCVDGTELKYIDDNFESYFEDFQLRTNKESDVHDNFIGFIKSIDYSNSFNAASKLNEYFSVDPYLNVLVVDVFLNNWDSYYGNGRNFYLYDDPIQNLLCWIPWDYNLSFSPYTAYIFPHDKSEDEFKPLIKQIEENPCLRNQYLNKMCNLLHQLDRQYWYSRIKELEVLISNSVEMDDNKLYSTSSFYENINHTVAVDKPNSEGLFMKVEHLPGIKEIFDVRPNEVQRDLFTEGFKCGQDYCEECIDIRAFPNPSTEEFTVEITSSKELLNEFSIISIDGKKMYNYSFTNDYQHFTWNSFRLPKGMYLLSISTKNQHIKTQKIIIY